MRALTVVAIACVLAAPAVLARAIPNPNQTHAPGNESPQVPIAEAGYNVVVNWQLQCSGCHLPEGEGSRPNDVPRMKGFVGNFLKVPEGREFLVRVPGIAQSALSDAQIAELLNWALEPQGMAGQSTPADYTRYTPEEVGAIRHQALLNLPDTRRQLIDRMRELGIPINDGMSN